MSSFGISGTNAHVILEAAPEPEPEPETQPGPGVWVLSGKTAAALQAQAARLAEHVRRVPEDSVADIGASLLRRGRFEHRAVVTDADRSELVAELAELAGGSSAGVVSGQAVPGASDVVLVFPGQGSQWRGMGRELRESSPVFRDALQECARVLDPLVGFSVVDVIRGQADMPSTELTGGSVVDRVDAVQPVLFAVMVALARVWQSWGVQIVGVVGHSQGEIAAACVSGALSLEDAATVVALRSRALRVLCGEGSMMSLALPREDAEKLTRQWNGVAVAAVNGAATTVISGPVAGLQGVADECERQGFRARWLPVDYASHSENVERIEAQLLSDLAKITPRSSEIPFYSTVTGDRLDTAGLDAAYWYRNLRQTVLFSDTIESLARAGHHAFVEISAHPVLVPALHDILQDSVVVGSLRRDEGSLDRLIRSAAEAFVGGVDVDWTKIAPAGRVVPLPLYPFQRQRFWLEPTPTVEASDVDEDAFWEIVERGDLQALTEDLGVAADTPLRELMPALSAWRHRRDRDNVVDQWRYRVVWRALPRTRSPAMQGRWLVVAPTGVADLTEPVAAALAADVLKLDTPDRTAWRDALAAHDGVTSIVSLLAFAEDAVTATVLLTQAVLDAGITARVWALTQGAVGTGPADPVRAPAQAQVWGTGRVIGLEHPELWGGLIDLPDEVITRDLAAVLEGDEDQIALRADGAYGRRLVRARPGRTAPWRTSGTALITGGTGGLGAHVARWMATHGAEHIVLTSRRGPDAPGAEELRAELEQLGVEVTIAACDAADRDALAELLDRVGAVRTVVHAAGVAQHRLIADMTAAEIAKVTKAKVDGALHLHELLNEELDAFVLFSSNSGVWGGVGQGAYAAANAWLDALAEHRRANGKVATSLAWGAWGGSGLAAEPQVQQQLDRRGIRAMDPAVAIAAMARALADDETSLAIADVDWNRFAPAYTAQRRRPLLDEIPEAVVEQPAAKVPAPRLAGTSLAERERVLTSLVQQLAAEALGYRDAEKISLSRPFREFGFDSLTAVTLRNKLAVETGLSLPSTLVFDHPTVTALARHLRAELDGDTEAEAARAALAPADDDPVVIVGMSCRLPGGITTPEDLWRVVDGGEDVVGGLPADRGWDEAAMAEEPFLPGAAWLTEGGFLDRAADFDPAFFGISDHEAMAMDPQQRLLLEMSWEALEQSGTNPHELRGEKVGVYLGTFFQSYISANSTFPEGVQPYLGGGSSPALASGRVSYVLGTQGPTLTVDTGCSSSAVALHLAVQAIRRGECTAALAGGVTVLSAPLAFPDLGGRATDGRCKAFSAAADGTGWGEGGAMVLLERLSVARERGHEVLAVVRGSAVNHNGAGNGLASPNGPSQQQVIRDALADAGLTTADVDVIEGHGTGTELGDTIEAQALIATYGNDRDRPVWVGTVKSNIGHPQAASGVTGVIKMVLAMRHGLMPRTLHAEKPLQDIERSTVRLLTEPRPWDTGDWPRRAAVSSFGASGTKVHIVLEQAPAQIEERDERPLPGGVPYLLSGATPAALARQAARLREHLQVNDLGATDLAFALATSRTAFEHRAAVLASDRDGLMRALTAIEHGSDDEQVRHGIAETGHKIAFVFLDKEQQVDEELRRSYPVFAAAAAGLPPKIARFDAAIASARLLESFGVVPEGVFGQGAAAAAAEHFGAAQPLDRLCDGEFTATFLFGSGVTLLDRAPEGSLFEVLAAAHVAGLDIDWRRVFAPTGARTAPLPTYAFDRRSFWLPRCTNSEDEHARRGTTQSSGDRLLRRHQRG
ncbi:MAG: SDR family NAD(P)-dependent oxidoreductase [Pseudonocardiaceae bacterium]